MDSLIGQLVRYGVEKGLLDPEDQVWARNQLLDCMGLAEDTLPPEEDQPLPEILEKLAGMAVSAGLCGDDRDSRDRFDTRLMGVLTPRPSQVRREFFRRYAEDPRKATDWYYAFSGDTNYIRRDRVARDQRWTAPSPYGELDLSINLSKPEKDPKVQAALRNAPRVGYPLCALCVENEGYAGRPGHPARQNHRIIPLQLAGEQWFFQYSPYVYFREHGILFCHEHRLMEISRKTFLRLLDFVTQFPHYFMGSNADLPIVGGSIQTHDHFQGGCYTFPVERAEEERRFAVAEFSDVSLAIVRWPVSLLRLRGKEPERVAALAGRILDAWRGYTDPEAMIFAETEGEEHNTITPIARRRGEEYELDLALRNNLTTPEHPMGLYHPHQEIHHIKRETIGLIEVMGLAVLPPRLKPELEAVCRCLLDGSPLTEDPQAAPHAPWAEGLRRKYTFTAENVQEIIRREVGMEFARGLEHAGVFKCTPEGRAAFARFVESL